MKFKPLIGDMGIPTEIRCRKCGEFVPDVDADSGLCRDCFGRRPTIWKRFKKMFGVSK